MEQAENRAGQLLDEEIDLWGVYRGPLQMVVWLDVGFQIFSRIGEQIGFSNTPPADELFLEPEIRFNIVLHPRADLSHPHQRLDVDEGRLFDASLSQLRLVYQVNIRTLFRLITQYTDISRNTTLYRNDDVDAKTQASFTQLLFSYKLNPRTVFFVGYSDQRGGGQDLSLTQQGRTLFLKLGCAWVL